MYIQRCPFGNPTTIRIEKIAVDWTEKRCKTKLIVPGRSFICEVNTQTNLQTPVILLFSWQHHYNNSFSFLLSYKNFTCPQSCQSVLSFFFFSFFLNHSIAFSLLDRGQLASQQGSSPDMQPVTHYMYNLLCLCLCVLHLQHPNYFVITWLESLFMCVSNYICGCHYQRRLVSISLSRHPPPPTLPTMLL